MSSVRVYVGNTPFQVTEQEVRDFFHPHKLTRINIILDRETKKPRGFLFVELATRSEADAAIAAMNGAQLGGRTLVINEAREKEARPRDDRRPRRDSNGGRRRNEGW